MAMNVITLGQLQKADVILSTTGESVSKVVRGATDSRFSHARLYKGGQYIIEAIEPVVREEKLFTVLRGDLYAAVYRVDNLTLHQQNNIIAYAVKQRGKGYDLSGAIGSSAAGIAAVGILPTISNLVSPESDFYCSELIALAYKSAGVKLERFSSLTTPKDLTNNDKLKYVGHLKVQGMQ